MKNWIVRYYQFVWVGVAVIAILVSLPRFNKADIGAIEEYTRKHKQDLGEFQLKEIPGYSDDMAYVGLVEYFRGEENPLVMEPFSYRIFVPYVASKLPFSPLTSINILNLIGLLLTVFSIKSILEYFSYPKVVNVVVGLIYAVSFQVFYYTGIGLVDPFLCGAIGLSVVFVIKNQYFLALILAIIAAFTKEPVVLLFPFVFLFYMKGEFNLRAALNSTKYFLPLFLAVVIVLALVRIYNPAEGGAYVWESNWERLWFNLTRFRSYASIALSIGLMGLLAIIFSIKYIKENGFWGTLRSQYAPFLVTFFFYFALIIYGFISVHIAGNHILPMALFASPLAAGFLVESKWFRNESA